MTSSEQRSDVAEQTAETLVLQCQRDLGGCGHRWEAPDPGDVFAECPHCHKGTGALV